MWVLYLGEAKRNNLDGRYGSEWREEGAEGSRDGNAKNTVTFYSDILSEICYILRGGIAYYKFGKGNGNFRISTASGHCILGLNQTAM